MKDLYINVNRVLTIDLNEIAIEDEIQECAEQLSINLEDQKWVELVASFTS